jgi:signal transduction histidine kinase
VRAGRQAARLEAALSEAERHAAEMDRLREVTEALLGGHELSGTLNTVARAAAELVGADSGHISLVSGDGKTLSLAAATGPLSGLVGRELPASGSMAGWVYEHDQPRISNDLASDRDAYAEVNRVHGFERGIMVPLRLRGAVIGALGADSRAGSRPLGPGDVALLERLGTLAVLAIENAKLLESSLVARASLSAKNEELKRAIQSKDAFLANMSHELRTPLNSIIGFSELLSTGALGSIGEGQKDFLDTIVRNSRHLLGLINDLLDLSKVEAGKMGLHLVATNMRELIGGVVRDASGLIASRDLRMGQELGVGALEVLADEVRIRQVLFNLVSNAVKFTPDGGEVTVRALRTQAPLPVPAERLGDGDKLKRRDAVWVAVRDTGPGIKPEDLPRLFQEFSQVDESLARRSGGTGLGLALSKRLIELHGGSIGVETLYGHGSTFWFILPVEGPVRQAQPVSAAG